ncbi:PDR/VanB family oxidoreductase [Ideonella sp. YS5]|uniref:PDR/VanB family oxidoreductase n=1 Tax=Ideonella sp. YS5 TaxID=3453714 RepID=UPI003EE9FE20
MSGTTLQVRIARKTMEAADIALLELAPLAGDSLPRFEAGAHIDVELPRGLLRQYSLCNDPAETHRYLIGVLRDPRSRGGSAAVHDELAEGQVIRIGAPRNHFALVPARRTLLLAGGIGITPLLCMAERLAGAGADFALHYCTRSAARTAFVRRIRSAPFAGQVHFHHDDGPAAQRLNLPAVLAPADTGTHVYVCGPGGFIDAVCRSAREQGWPEAQIHFERFSAPAAEGKLDRPFELHLARSRRTLTVPAGQTVAQALRAHGVQVQVSCEQGVCGTCLTPVLEGEPEHRDSYLSDEEKRCNDQFTPCCSRARGERLVLDL